MLSSYRCVVRSFSSSNSQIWALVEKRISDHNELLLDSKEVSRKEIGQMEQLKELKDSQDLLQNNKSELQAMLKDEELAEVAQMELDEIEEELEELTETMVERLLKEEDDGDHKDGTAILEVRAGTGGTEASLFSAELFEMYRSFIKNEHGSDLRFLQQGDNTIAEITGDYAYSLLKFESGTHRVQRKPVTDNKRIHTSTCTVAVLEAVGDEVDVEIADSDLQIDTYRSSGAGGQHVNTTDSAVRITHKPTGFVVTISDERSQHRNKDKAMRLIRSRIHDFQKNKQKQERANQRRSLIGSGERNERIRTYNWPNDRITDHRINYSVSGIDSMLRGELLAELIEKLGEHERALAIDHLLKRG